MSAVPSAFPLRQEFLPTGMARLMTPQQFQQLLELVPTITGALDTSVPLFWQTLALMARSANCTGETFYLGITDGRAVFTPVRNEGSCVEMHQGRWYVHVTTPF